MASVTQLGYLGIGVSDLARWEQFAANVLGLEAYTLAFLKDLAPTLGLASALGWLLFAAALVIALINLRMLRSRT